MNGDEACQTANQCTSNVFVGIDVFKLALYVARLRSGKVRNKVFGNDHAGFWPRHSCADALTMRAKRRPENGWK